MRISERVQGFTESVIREMTRVVSQYAYQGRRDLGRTTIRFCFPKTDDVLIDAGERLQKLRQLAG